MTHYLLNHYSDCRTDWSEIGSKCYRVYPESVDFQLAFKSCQNKYARLATLADKKTQDKVTGKESRTTTATDVFLQRND